MSRAVSGASFALVLAVWASLHLAQRRSDEQVGDPSHRPAAELATGRSGAGFRQDLYQLPDDSLLGLHEIPAGPFTMGSDPARDPAAFDIEWWGDGRVQATVDLPRFFLSRTEVTVAQYAAYLHDTGRTPADPRTLEAPPNHPVAFVSWPEAVAYARWLDEALRTSDTTPPLVAELLARGWRVTLPDEAQWEKAARGVDGRLYPWGDSLVEGRANFRSRSPAPVGSFPCPECAHGLRDMAGNVWEWTRSPFQPYPFDADDDRVTVDDPALWVMRGGSFQDDTRFIRAANRGGADPGARRPFIGFRLALDCQSSSPTVTAPDSTSRRTSSSEYPSSRRTSAVC